MEVQFLPLVLHLTAIMSRPYDTVNAEQLQRDADDCLLHYGTTFHPEIITSTDGIYMETASGHRMMDVRHCRAHVRIKLIFPVYLWPNVNFDRTWTS
jgi:hypothetical protein